LRREIEREKGKASDNKKGSTRSSHYNSENIQGGRDRMKKIETESSTGFELPEEKR